MITDEENQNAKTITNVCMDFGFHVVFVKAVQCPSFTNYIFKNNDNGGGRKLSGVDIISNVIGLALYSQNGTVRVAFKHSNDHLFLNIEVPNERNGVVLLKNMIDKYKESGLQYQLPIVLGIDEENKERFADLVDLKHILMAGTTGSGKSVIANNIILSLFQLVSPDQVKFFLVDMKRVSLLIYNGHPQLFSKVAVEINDVITNLELLVAEKRRRLEIPIEKRNFPFMVVIIDTISDLMFITPQEFESLIVELSKDTLVSRIHIILSDSRPQPEVFTNLFKANFPTRIAGNTSSSIDSQVILGMSGAEKLLGMGDTLILLPNLTVPVRIQAPFMSEKEIMALLKQFNK